MAEPATFNPFGGGMSPAMIRALQQYQLGGTLATGAAKQDASSGLGVLAKILQGGLGGYLQTSAGKDAADIQQNVSDTTDQALRAGAGWKSPDPVYAGPSAEGAANSGVQYSPTNEAIRAPAGTQLIKPDMQRYYDVLRANPNTAQRGQDEQVAAIKKQQELLFEQQKALGAKGIKYDPTTGQATAIPGYGAAMGGIGGEEAYGKGVGEYAAKVPGEVALLTATGPVKARNAAQEAWAVNPALVTRAGGEAGAREAATLPYAAPRAMATEIGRTSGLLSQVPAGFDLPPGVPNNRQAALNYASAGGSAAGTADAGLSPPGAGTVRPPVNVDIPNTRTATQSYMTESGQQGAQAPSNVRKTEAELRNEFNSNSQVVKYQQARVSYDALKDAATRDTKAADLNMIYALANLFDPGSVVREGEQVLVKNTANLSDALIGQINSLNGGGRLDGTTRANLISEAEGRFGQHQKAYEGLTQNYGDIARRNGVNPSNVFAVPSAPSVAPAPQPVGLPPLPAPAMQQLGVPAGPQSPAPIPGAPQARMSMPGSTTPPPAAAAPPNPAQATATKTIGGKQYYLVNGQWFTP